MTTALLQPGDCSAATPEFGRISDLSRLFGIRRGTAYNLLAIGAIRGCLLRVKGQKSGVRLIHLESVRDYLHAQMTAQNNEGAE